MKIIAHRSGPTILPEQTMESAYLAGKNGADMIEVDVRFTKDRGIAVSHDENAKRIFGVDKNISEMTTEEFNGLRHIENKEFSSHLFEEYLAGGIAPLLIHVKEDEVIDDLLTLLERYQYLDKVVLGVQSTEAVNKIKNYNKTIMVLAFIPNLESIPEFGETEADFIRLWEGWLTIDTAESVRKYNKEVWIMTNDGEVGVTTPENLAKIMEFQVDGILINDITQLKNFRED